MMNKPMARYILRVFLSYLLAIGIPVLVLAGYFLLDTVPRMRSELYDGYGETVMADARRMSETLESITDFSFSVSALPYLRELQTSSYKNAIFAYSQMLSFLRVFRQSSECCSGVSVFIRHSGLLLSTDGMTVLPAAGSEMEDVLNAFSSAKQFRCCYPSASGRLLILSTLPKYYFSSDIILLFSLNMDALYEDRPIDNLTLYRRDGKKLMGDFDLEASAVENLSTVDSSPLEITQGASTLFYLYEPMADLFMLRIYRADALSGIVNASVRLSVLVLVSSLLAACAIAYFLARQHTKPITRLSESLKSIEPIRMNEGGTIFESIAAKLDSLKARSEQYRESLTQNAEIVKDRAIQNMLWSHIPGSDTLASFLHKAGIQIVPEHYYAVLIHTNCNAAIKQFNKLCEINVLVKNLIEQHLREEVTIVGGAQLDIGEIVFILGSTGETLTEEEADILRRVFGEAEESLASSFLVRLRVAIGRPVDSTEALCESFVNLRGLLRRPQPEEQIFFQSGADEPSPFYPDYYQVNLAGGIQSGDSRKVLTVLEQMFRLEEHGMSGEDALSFQYLTVGNVMTRLMNATGTVRGSGLDLLRIFNDEPDPDKRRAKLTEHLLMLTETFKSQNLEAETSAYIASAKEYIRRNLHHDLSLGDIADYVGIHTSYFSRIFKQETGLTPLQYITALRVDKAKQELRRDKSSVKQVGKELGYNDTRSFIRSFKKIEGCTPGEFRAGISKED